MAYKTQLKLGKKVEKEHLPYFRQIKKQKKCPTEEQFVEGIAKAHLSESPTYYSRLKRAGL
jgi:hypothetical protein